MDKVTTVPTRPRLVPFSRTKLSVLFVDDDAGLLASFGRYLEAAGLDVTAIEDPHAAVTQARERQPHVIVLDMAMPGLDGFAVMSALLRERETAQIPVVLFTALPWEDAFQKPQVRACVQKPCTPKDLLGVVRMIGGRA
jgi:CheY-like chemotaxis protein